MMIIISMASVVIAGFKENSNPAGSNMSITSRQNTIISKSFAFSLAVDTISHGTTSTWKNDDGIAHTATSDRNAWDTGSISSERIKTIIFNTVGSFPYHYSIHPSMTGIIIVK